MSGCLCPIDDILTQMQMLPFHIFYYFISDLNKTILWEGGAVLQDVFAGRPLCVCGCLSHRRPSPTPTPLLRNGKLHKQSQHHLDSE